MPKWVPQFTATRALIVLAWLVFVLNVGQLAAQKTFGVALPSVVALVSLPLFPIWWAALSIMSSRAPTDAPSRSAGLLRRLRYQIFGLAPRWAAIAATLYFYTVWGWLFISDSLVAADRPNPDAFLAIPSVFALVSVVVLWGHARSYGERVGA
jgi:hypothetical protein